MCFEKAADKYGEKLAKATGLKAAADRMHFSNPEMFSITCREAAEIFNSIGKAALAAECFYMLKDYETAGPTSFHVPFLILLKYLCFIF